MKIRVTTLEKDGVLPCPPEILATWVGITPDRIDTVDARTNIMWYVPFDPENPLHFSITEEK